MRTITATMAAVLAMASAVVEAHDALEAKVVEQVEIIATLQAKLEASCKTVLQDATQTTQNAR